MLNIGTLVCFTNLNSFHDGIHSLIFKNLFHRNGYTQYSENYSQDDLSLQNRNKAHNIIYSINKFCMVKEPYSHRSVWIHHVWVICYIVKRDYCTFIHYSHLVCYYNYATFFFNNAVKMHYCKFQPEMGTLIWQLSMFHPIVVECTPLTQWLLLPLTNNFIHVWSTWVNWMDASYQCNCAVWQVSISRWHNSYFTEA